MFSICHAGDNILWMEVNPYDKSHRNEVQKYLLWLVENREGEKECTQISVYFTLLFFILVKM